ncbi:class III lanthionine synthetase LanKC [Kitasatospora sp. RB6PN24]|uniref:class III lanthionine synthetase LanKC n=1 Tax=Kitasatospora humi TaxID=2893891 RepID=UPI001E2BBB3A|nr:class III lanthionine synthetase LanKC [Kitasatospora humi]MCC9305834.1 class III lanthionine synthetase LanKC [Kitasatospora humi]
MLGWESLLHYAQADPRWYETSSRVPFGDAHLALFRAAAGDGWRTFRRGPWFIANPPGVAPVAQGWKLHVTAEFGGSATILGKALPVLCEARVPFKFLIDEWSANQACGKVFARTASGKFITAYPVDDEQFHAVGTALAKELEGHGGPYILTDRRWPGSTAVYYRYGGFAAQRQLRPDGASDLMITAPDGTLVLDARRPWFEVPEWATDPFPPEPDEPDGLLGGRYQPLRALSFGNRGGVYLATDTQTGQEVVLKEARHGVTIGDGVPATEVLEKEYQLLRMLSDTGLFVKPLGFFREWEHAFLVEEKVEGQRFSRHGNSTNPVITGELAAESIRSYYRGVRGLWRQIAEAIEAAHQRGILLGDLSYTNVYVDPDGHSITIIDLEAAVREDVDPHLGVFTMGSASPRLLATRRYDRAADWHALGALIFSSLMVVNSTVGFHRPVLPRFLAELAADLALPGELIALVQDLTDEHLTDDALTGSEVLERIDALPFDDPALWAAPVPLALPATERYGDPEQLPGLGDAELASVVEGIARYAEAAADPQRSDRLFPADPLVFETNPLSLSFGAAGVLHGLQRLRGTVPARLRSWVLAQDVDSAYYPPGLFTGQAGIAWVLDELGYTPAALTLMDRARAHPLRFAAHNVLHGSAGYGLACLQLWQRTGEQRLLDDARAAGEALAAAGVRGDTGVHWPEPERHGRPSPTRLGYAYGASGISLFLLYLHLATGDRRWGELGRAALGFDLEQAVVTADDRWFFRRYARSADDDEPPADPVLRCYWDEGTAGVATAALRWLVARPDRELEAAVPRLVAGSVAKYTVMPQLFHGLAGQGNLLLDAGELLGEERWFAEARRVAQGVLLSRIERPEGIAFPGEQAIRESVDLATGSIGVALFLDRLRHARPGGRTNAFFTVDGLLP